MYFVPHFFKKKHLLKVAILYIQAWGTRRQKASICIAQNFINMLGCNLKIMNNFQIYLYKDLTHLGFGYHSGCC